MGDNPGEMRLSNAERQEALDALEEHVRTGRLDVDEYADRSAKVTVATRRGELEPLFADLPAPHPSVLSRELFTPSITGPAPRLTPAQALAAKAVPITAVIALVLFFTVARGFWPVFLLPAAAALLAGSFGRRDRRG
ncbi:hypothetical protein YIM_43000 [Amycolatopsis sp. YIM 10]|nr:DUF1707 domain-containing protein [Amycolatopsis sp. YIM 10]QFU93735.1 hypothetical protein YIM_43000 [Amycolatopsis sp. YIM 10]